MYAETSVTKYQPTNLISPTLVLLISTKFKENLFNCSLDVACGRWRRAGADSQAHVAKRLFSLRILIYPWEMCSFLSYTSLI
jgi:hypothetical protein